MDQETLQNLTESYSYQYKVSHAWPMYGTYMADPLVNVHTFFISKAYFQPSLSVASLFHDLSLGVA